MPARAGPRGVARAAAEYVLGGRDLELAGRLDVHMRGDALVDHDREALAAHAHAETLGIQFQPQGARIVAVAIGQHQHLVADVGCLAPGIHDEHVIDRHAGDGIDALGAQLICQLEIARQMLGIAGRREGPGHREQHHALAIEQLGSAQVLADPSRPWS